MTAERMERKDCHWIAHTSQQWIHCKWEHTSAISICTHRRQKIALKHTHRDTRARKTVKVMSSKRALSLNVQTVNSFSHSDFLFSIFSSRFRFVFFFGFVNAINIFFCKALNCMFEISFEATSKMPLFHNSHHFRTQM